MPAPLQTTLIDDALDAAATAQMVHLFDMLIGEENLGPAMASFEKDLRQLIAAYNAVADLILVLKAEPVPEPGAMP